MAMRKTKTTRYSRKRNNTKIARPWSRQEVAFMRKFYKKFETAWIARQLGRTVYSVRYKAVDLSIKKANPSVWKGNKGSASAFRIGFGGKSTARPAARRAKKSTRGSKSRSYRATSRRTTTRKATPRKTRKKVNRRR